MHGLQTVENVMLNGITLTIISHTHLALSIHSDNNHADNFIPLLLITTLNRIYYVTFVKDENTKVELL